MPKNINIRHAVKFLQHSQMGCTGDGKLKLFSGLGLPAQTLNEFSFVGDLK